AAEPRNAHLPYRLGMLAIERKEYEAAIDWLGKALSIDRSKTAYHANLGEAYRHLGRNFEATACYKNALRTQPDFAPLHAMLGVVLRSQQRHDEAAASLREALRLKHDYREARTHLGNVLVDLKQYDEAEQ